MRQPSLPPTSGTLRGSTASVTSRTLTALAVMAVLAVLSALMTLSGTLSHGIGGGPAGAASKTTLRARSTTTTIRAGVPKSTTMLDGCPVFPGDNAWNTDVTTLRVRQESTAWLKSVNGAGVGLHPDFGSDPDYGIPYLVVPATQQRFPVAFDEYGDESDPGPYPIPLDAPIEQGDDAHVLALQKGTCRLFELYHARPGSDGWTAGSGATFDLRSNATRPKNWTSTDAAGLPILPGLVRYDEVRSGTITHALRVTFRSTQNGFIAPARHAAGQADPALPPMGARLRLRANFDLSGFRGDSLVILTAMKRYGLIVADNGSPWFFSGATDSRWNDDDLAQLKKVPGTVFDFVDNGSIEKR